MHGAGRLPSRGETSSQAYSLEELLAPERRLPFAITRRVAIEVLEALAYLYDLDVTWMLDQQGELGDGAREAEAGR